jgi:hypothetical protein
MVKNQTAKKNMTEKEMRDSEVPTPKNLKELDKYISSLVDQKQDYGTCCYAMSMAAEAAFNYVADKLGVTGFQASCADLDFLRRTRRMENGFKIINYTYLLYPQYLDKKHFPSYNELLSENRISLAVKADKLLKEIDSRFPISQKVVAHWKKLSANASAKEKEGFGNKI